jgi:hypothetical protein
MRRSLATAGWSDASALSVFFHHTTIFAGAFTSVRLFQPSSFGAGRVFDVFGCRRWGAAAVAADGADTCRWAVGGHDSELAARLNVAPSS